MKKKMFIGIGALMCILHLVVISGYFTPAISQTNLSSPSCTYKQSGVAGKKSDGESEVLCVSCKWISYKAQTSPTGIYYLKMQNEEDLFYKRAECVTQAGSSCTQIEVLSRFCPSDESAPGPIGSGSGTGS
ncbi:hypothetical protein [Sphingobacterium sp. BIGb0165]|uniref:hypothetical protein n=1 Tax=Sphingobacterium sp. BIGb0165 TaxID=2940615 RepID=UPI0021694667|nr:hypothetical protein [Sphingobacterium sp. BIGb0165]MCS4226914.1 hypothetical protein [Sphingobacterium sp. BIGb0165]